MQIFFPVEICQPADDGIFRRRRQVCPVPNKQITIEEEWHVQDDGTLLVLEEWEVNACDNDDRMATLWKSLPKDELLALFEEEDDDDAKADIAAELARRGGAR